MKARDALAAVPPALFLLALFVVPLVAIARVSGAATSLPPWEQGRLAASLQLGALTALLALAFGLPLAYLLGRYRFPGRRVLRALVTVPFVMPVVVMAAGLLVLLGPRGYLSGLLGVHLQLQGTYALLLIAHTIYNVPLVVRLVGDTWSHLDPRLEEAAATLGAGPWARFTRVTLPRLLPSIAAATLLAFLFGFAGFGTVLLLADPIKHATLEVAIWYDGVALFDLPTAATLALEQLVVTFLAALAYAALARRAARWERPVDEETALRPLRVGPLVIFAFVVAACLLAPLIGVIVRALDTPAGWGFAAFARVWHGAGLVFSVGPAVALQHSLVFATATVLIAVPLGLLAARAASRSGSWLDAVWMLPLGASSVTLGLGLLVMFPIGPLDLRATATLVVLAHALIAFPFVARALTGPMQAQDPALGEAAATLGAGPAKRAWRVHLPLLGPALVVGAALAASVSLGEFGATLVLLRPETTTLPTELYRYVSASKPDPWLQPEAMALGTILLALNVIVFLVLERLRPGRSGGF